MRICKLLLMTLLMVFSANAFAQTPENAEDQKVIKMREKLGIDYSMPDFDTKKIDGKVIKALQ